MAITGSESKPHIRVPIPGPKARRIVARDHQAVATTTKTSPIAAARALGAVVEDVDGNILLDFAAGIGVLNTGHCHPRVVKAVQDQAARLMHFAGTDFYYDVQATLAERLGAIAPVKGPAKTFFSQSGTEANEAALKVARAATGRSTALAFLGAFHGRTLGSLALTASKPRQRERFLPLGGVVHAPYPNPYRNPWRIDGYADPQELANRAIEWVEGLLDTVAPASDVATVFYEPVQGEGGYVVPPKPFARMLRKVCDEHGILLSADEVQTGMGRTGKMFALEHFGVKADTVSLAKALGSGLPIGATVFRAKLDFDAKGRHSNTFGGNLVACAAADATLDVFAKEDLCAKSAQRGKQVHARLRDMQQERSSIGDVRGLGLMQAVEFVQPGTKGPGGQPKPDVALRDRVEQECWKRGLIVLGTGKSGIRFIPPLIVFQDQVEAGMDIFEEAVAAAEGKTPRARRSGRKSA